MNQELEELSEKAVKYAKERGAQYTDARAEEYERKSILIRKWQNREQ